MDIEAYYQSLHAELFGLRDRVRFLIGDAHWPTDGGWKESVLRTVLRRSLGTGVEVGHGFFVSGDLISPQLDLLVYRSDAPVLFRDGNLVIVPAQAVRAVVEVKTRLTMRTLHEGVDHLIRACDALPRRSNVMVGLFAYESELASSQPILEHLRERASKWPHRIDLVCHGPTRFVRYWNTPPTGGQAVYEKWHSYDLPETSFGYFLHNLVTHLSPSGFPRSGEPFYPREGKELHKDGEIYRDGALIERFERLERERQGYADEGNPEE